TLGCLRTLASQIDDRTEIILVDNHSTDETDVLLARVDGLTVVRHGSNLGFTVGANAGAARARGEFVLFLNNAAGLVPGSLDHFVRTARTGRSVGAVGGKLILPDGRLQEAGSIIWSDGSCAGYGRGSDPAAPAFDFERPVDFCSGALLFTRRDLFDE